MSRRKCVQRGPARVIHLAGDEATTPYMYNKCILNLNIKYVKCLCEKICSFFNIYKLFTL